MTFSDATDPTPRRRVALWRVVEALRESRGAASPREPRPSPHAPASKSKTALRRTRYESSRE
jgi:hypothetical protein